MKIVIFGNSGSGKSTMAQKLSVENKLAHLDLDTIAWQPTKPPKRKAISQSKTQIQSFTESNDHWVIEGCYSDLLELAMLYCDEIIFLNLGTRECQSNAKTRPFEPHKYATKEAQDANLEMLLSWIAKYDSRTDTFSKQSHLLLFKNFKKNKTMYTTNQRNDKCSLE